MCRAPELGRAPAGTQFAMVFVLSGVAAIFLGLGWVVQQRVATQLEVWRIALVDRADRVDQQRPVVVGHRGHDGWTDIEFVGPPVRSSQLGRARAGGLAARGVRDLSCVGRSASPLAGDGRASDPDRRARRISHGGEPAASRSARPELAGNPDRHCRGRSVCGPRRRRAGNCSPVEQHRLLNARCSPSAPE